MTLASIPVLGIHIEGFRRSLVFEIHLVAPIYVSRHFIGGLKCRNAS